MKSVITAKLLLQFSENVAVTVQVVLLNETRSVNAKKKDSSMSVHSKEIEMQFKEYLRLVQRRYCKPSPATRASGRQTRAAAPCPQPSLLVRRESHPAIRNIKSTLRTEKASLAHRCAESLADGNDEALCVALGRLLQVHSALRFLPHSALNESGAIASNNTPVRGQCAPRGRGQRGG